MRFVIASVVCFIELGLYVVIFAFFNLTDLLKDANTLVRIFAVVPLLLISRP